MGLELRIKTDIGETRVVYLFVRSSAGLPESKTDLGEICVVHLIVRPSVGLGLRIGDRSSADSCLLNCKGLDLKT